ncbi:hypothetical protein PMNALOAF_4265 [Methylobacterium adhaesivum]|jgi:hypothetical protein|uniref:Uncharacterized protein n=1 Tax=Methylobacterium adhaesivum TaxID=333297 RepID=A0ABT8BIJ5_9HYPH|nr:hypothetical protein [Methylobacterium adhaesivum]MDN3591987.1 hypothetical protein [Methylobacterium adhaesivum]GJD32984.1 hypothetical protein PMNALOAF_4265 [Methylobacterium adhaesivum]
MIDDPASPVPPRRLNELSQLASRLAERVLSEQDADQSIPEGHIHALLDAAILLDKYEAEMPAALSQIVDQVDDASRESDDGASGLAWLLRPFQGTKEA